MLLDCQCSVLGGANSVGSGSWFIGIGCLLIAFEIAPFLLIFGIGLSVLSNPLQFMQLLFALLVQRNLLSGCEWKYLITWSKCWTLGACGLRTAGECKTGHFVVKSKVGKFPVAWPGREECLLFSAFFLSFSSLDLLTTAVLLLIRCVTVDYL